MAELPASGALAPRPWYLPGAVTVAASDASSESKYNADYVCDGTADEVEINAAIAALPSAGGTVELTEGTFTPAATIALANNVCLRGSGYGTKLFTTAATQMNVVSASSKSGFAVLDLRIDGNLSNQTPSGSENTENGIYLSACTDFRVEGCWLDANASSGMTVDASSLRGVIANNICTGNQRNGMYLQAFAGANEHITVVGNVCRNAVAFHGIAITGGKHLTLASNVCEGNAITGISCDGNSDFNTITGNVCEGNGWHGLEFIYVSTTQPQYNLISDNIVIANARDGIRLQGATHNTIAGNLIYGNATGGSYQGILLHTYGAGSLYSTNNHIVGNRITATHQYGIKIEDATDDNNIVEQNQLSGNATGAISDASGTTVYRNNEGYTVNAGSANTGVTASEHSDGYNFVTTLTVSQTNALTLGDDENLADGYLLYTFPAGTCVIDYAYMTMAVQAAGSELPSDTPDVGLGTVIASGAVATLDGTATFEDIVTGQTAADCDGTATVKTALPTAGVPFVIESGDAHTLHFNVADTWADDTGGDLTADIAGTVVIGWRFLA